jgi:hypothetical protein
MCPRLFHIIRLLAVSFLASLLTAGTACAKEAGDTNSSNSASSVYAFSMLAPGAENGIIIYARIVFNRADQTCPTLHGDNGSAVATQVRPMYPAGSVTSAPIFPVTVCEGVMTEGVAYTIKANKININAVTLKPASIQVYGDSGCDDKKKCSGVQPSPQFQTLAKRGAKQPTDLILHMGDYNYRGTSGSIAKVKGQKVYAYDAGDGTANDSTCGYTTTYNSQNSRHSPRPDVWKNWQADFFEAGKKLLPKAPWVFARGNHELCSRAGPGWFYFLGPGSSLAGSQFDQMQCPDQGHFSKPPAGAKKHISMIPPYMLSLGQIQFWVMDTANACDTSAGNKLTEEYTKQYQQLADRARKSATATWVITHRPIWGFQKSDKPTLNQMLQTALANTSAGVLPGSVTLSLAGHMHIFESLTFHGNPTRPPQIVIGNSGVTLANHPSPGKFKAKVDKQKAKGNAAQEFGFLTATIADDGSWKGKILGTKDNTLLDCDSANVKRDKKICK